MEATDNLEVDVLKVRRIELGETDGPILGVIEVRDGYVAIDLWRSSGDGAEPRPTIMIASGGSDGPRVVMQDGRRVANKGGIKLHIDPVNSSPTLRLTSFDGIAGVGLLASPPEGMGFVTVTNSDGVRVFQK